MRVLVLLSPAKTLNWTSPPASLSALWSEPVFLPEADPVIEVMRSKSKADLKKLMSVSDSIADLNHKRFQQYLSADEAQHKIEQHPTGEDLFRPAALAYDGPAFRGLDATSFSEEDWAFSARSVRLLSGLYGVLKPTDLIQPYRLEMGSRVSVAERKDLYAYWKGKVTEGLLEDIGRRAKKGSNSTGSAGDFLLVNVASQEYFKAVDLPAMQKAGGKVVTCVFKDDGRVLSVFAKRARGLLARHVVISRAKDVSDLANFTSEGYRLDRAQSDEHVLVFARSKGQRPTSPPQAASASSAAGSGKGKKRSAAVSKPPESSALMAKKIAEKKISPAKKQKVARPAASGKDPKDKKGRSNGRRK